MKWLKRAAIACAVLLLLAAAVPFFIKLDDFIPRIEKEASAKLKEPVTIKSLKLAMLPVPHVTIDGIAIGKAEIEVGQVTVTPVLASLLSSPKVIRSIEVKSLVLTQKALDKIPVWTKSDGTSAPPVRIENIKLTDAVVKLDKTGFGPFDATVELDSNGQPVNALITTQDGKLKASVKPDKANFLIDAVAKGWKPPVGAPILFDELVIKGIATAAGADFNQISAKLYGGMVNGRATAGWQKGLRVKGNLDVKQVELKSLVPLFSPTAKISGRLTAKPVFFASGADAAQLLNALHLETPFEVQNGILYGVDIAKAATSLVKGGATGGETHFDHLSGHLVRERGAHKFTDLKISSGSLAAEGNVNISAKQELAGRVKAEIKAAGTSAGIPLNVAGTVQTPLVYPTGGTMAGAALGSVLLPGVGTGVGAKIGQTIEGLFDKKKK